MRSCAVPSLRQLVLDLHAVWALLIPTWYNRTETSQKKGTCAFFHRIWQSPRQGYY